MLGVASLSALFVGRLVEAVCRVASYSGKLHLFLLVMQAVPLSYTLTGLRFSLKLMDGTEGDVTLQNQQESIHEFHHQQNSTDVICMSQIVTWGLS